jgi:hypothetical protein
MNSMKRQKQKLSKNAFLPLSLLLFTFSCQLNNENEELKQAFIDHVEKIAGTGDSLVLSSLTGFQWDSFRVVDKEYDQENIKNIIGFDYPCRVVPNWHVRYLFWNSKNETACHFDLPHRVGICYNCGDYEVLTPEAAIFVPAVEPYNVHIGYWLNPVSCSVVRP